MNSTDTLATKQADWVAALQFEQIPAEVVSRAKLCLLDFLGVMLKGSTLPQVAPVNALLGLGGVKGQATVCGGVRSSVPYAAYVNGTYGHSCEFDDCNFNAGHPGVCVIPAALAMAEKQNASGKELLTAIVAGYQAMLWSVGPIHHRTLQLGWHGTKVGGVFGAAATAAKLLGLSAEQCANALAVAGSDASGTMEYDQSGGEIKRFHAGMASRAGVEAALLAEVGLTGPLTIFEGKRGIHRLFSEGCAPDVDAFWQDEYHIESTMFKLYPCAGTLHAALDCVREIRGRNAISLADIAEIEVGIVEWAIPHGAAIVHPTDAISAQFSLAFSIGLQFITDDNAFDDFMNPECWNNEEILSVARKVKPTPMVVPDDASELCARVVVRAHDGRTDDSFRPSPRGFPTNPASAEDLRTKFRSVTSGLLSSEQAEEVVMTVDTLDEQSSLEKLIRVLEMVSPAV